MNNSKKMYLIVMSAITIASVSFFGYKPENITSSAVGTQSISSPSEYVIIISVDGMGSEYVKTFINSSTNNLTTIKKVITEGSSTLNARNDKDYTITLPNHTSMITSRRVTGTSGHNWITNVDPDPGVTLASNKGSYISSMFDIAHDNGLRTGLWAGKSKFVLFKNSYDAINGANDLDGINNGRDKIDYENIYEDGLISDLTTDFINKMTSNPFHLSFIHYADPDREGHTSGWSTDPNSAYAGTLKRVDNEIARIVQMVETNSILQGKTTIIITADHGGYQTQHDTATNPLNFTIPFIVWGKGVSPRSDLYILNTSSRVSPNATTNPAYTGIQPIRNGDAGNLALHLLGLGPIPNSMINNNQDLKVQGVRTCKPWN